MQKKYEKLMRECLKLAQKAEGKTSPNPMVGAVIFDDDFNIISKGYHEKYGEAHAEVNAVKNAGQSVRGLSIAVNLEPCSHHGKTPPCADMIIREGIKRVVVGMRDPNPVVYENGIKKLKDAGIEVITGILEDECRKLNEVFVKDHMEEKPFVAIKTATTLDGKIACENGSSKWITSEKSRKIVQKLRNKYDAILTGSNTIMKDNPSLNCRLKNGKNPIRIVVDSKLKTDPKSKVYKNDGTKIYIITDKDMPETAKQKYQKHIEFINCSVKNEKINLEEAFDTLYKKGTKSILVEAGANLNYAIIKNNLADKLIQFIAPKILGDKGSISFVEGFRLNDINNTKNLEITEVKNLKPDIMIEAFFKK